jgi:hypothetical protein
MFPIPKMGKKSARKQRSCPATARKQTLKDHFLVASHAPRPWGPENEVAALSTMSDCACSSIPSDEDVRASLKGVARLIRLSQVALHLCSRK